MTEDFEPTERITVEILPLECWPHAALLELRQSIAAALKAKRLQGHSLLVALQWADMVDDELEARRKLRLE